MRRLSRGRSFEMCPRDALRRAALSERGYISRSARPSERDVVVDIAAAASPAAAHQRRAAFGGRAAAEARGALFAAAAAVAALAGISRIEQGQLAAEARQHDLGDLFFDARLVGVFPALDLTLDVDLGALFAILFGDLADILVEDHDVVPLGALLALAGVLVLPGFGRRQGEADDAIAGIEVGHFRVFAEVADQNDFVDAARHDALLTTLKAASPATRGSHGAKVCPGSNARPLGRPSIDALAAGHLLPRAGEAIYRRSAHPSLVHSRRVWRWRV